MTEEELDTLWTKALRQSVEDGTLYTRYRFAELVAAAEREACAKLCDELQSIPATEPRHCAEDIRARGNT